MQKVAPAMRLVGATASLQAMHGMLASRSPRFFAGIEIFYDFVSHAILAAEGDADGFPEGLLRALCGFYAGPRVVGYGQACSEVIEAGGTILAGCSCATVLAKVLVFRLLSGLQGKYAGMHVKNVVDDISLQVAGTQR